jgi:hypothetical protein
MADTRAPARRAQWPFLASGLNRQRIRESLSIVMMRMAHGPAESQT